MKMSPLRLLFTALVSGTLLASVMAVPASAQNISKWRGHGFTAGSSLHYAGYRGRSVRHRGYGHRSYGYRSYGYRSYGYRSYGYRSYGHRHRHHSRDLAIGLAIGIIGSALAAQHHHH